MGFLIVINVNKIYAHTLIDYNSSTVVKSTIRTRSLCRLNIYSVRHFDDF